MSQVSSDDGAIIAAFQTDLVDSFVIYSQAGLIAYEYILTVNQEVTMIWRRRWTLATWLFIANRYLMIALIIWDVSPVTAQSCFPSMMLYYILFLAQYVIFAAFSALRVFAIWDRHIPMTLLVFGLNLVPVVTNLYTFIESTAIFTVDPILGSFCGVISNLSVRTDFQLSLGTRLAFITADVLVLALTWHKTFTHRMNAIKAGVQTPLSNMLLRDGTVYFVALLAMNIAQMVSNTVPSLQNVSPLSTLIQVYVYSIQNASTFIDNSSLTPILFSRFLLNLRQLGEPASENETHSRFNSRFSIPGFRVPTLESVVGNMGAELDHGPTEEVDDHDEGGEADLDGGDVEVAVFDVITEDGSDGLVTESVYEIQEVPRQMA